MPVDKIYEKHSSTPYNPKIADVFYKAGEIESWGRGFHKIMEGCKEEKASYPVIDANARGVMVLCKPCDQYNRLWQRQNVISIDCVKLEFWNKKALAGVHIMNENKPINEPRQHRC